MTLTTSMPREPQKAATSGEHIPPADRGRHSADEAIEPDRRDLIQQTIGAEARSVQARSDDVDPQ